MADDTYGLTTLEASGANSVALSPDETRIFVARSNGNVDVFDVASRALIASWDIGASLGGLSISEDGSFLLAVELSIAPAPPAQSSVLYRVDTTTGAVTTYTKPGQAFLDVEIVDGDTALVTGGQSQLQRLDLTTGTFSDVANGVWYSNSSTAVEDEHLTLLAESGISNGPLAIYDDRTDTIVARGDNYQTGASSGFNWGHVAISESAGLVVQFSYYAGLNIFDLNLQFQRWMSISGPVDGVAFDPSGTYLYVRLVSGSLEQYVAATGALVESFPLGASSWHNNPGAADQITFSADGKTILVHDNNTGKLELIDLHQRDQQIEGTAGGEALDGGRGDDTYIVNHAGDTVTELQYQGVDTVRASVDFTLSAHVERLELTGSAINGTGNELRNDIVGNDQANTLNGAGGNDWIVGNGGDDVLFGGTGDDTLLGQGGNDTLWGEDGDDTLDGGDGNDTVNGGSGDDTAYVTGGTTSADTDTETVSLADNIELPGSNADEYGADHLIVDYSQMTQNVVFMGPTQDDIGYSFGSNGAEGRVKIGGDLRLTFEGVGRLTVTTGSGDDRVYATGGSDVISAGAGNDVIYDFSFGAIVGHRTRIDGGTGVDQAFSVNWEELTTAVVLDVNSPAGVTIGTGEDQRYLRGVESLYGFTTGSGNDVITLHASGALQNVVSTNAGDDTVTVYGGATAAATEYHNIDMGSGGDDHLIVDFSAATQQVVYLANSGGGGGTAIGGVQHHTYANIDRVTLTTGSGNDVVDARNQSFSRQVFSTGSGADELHGGFGDDSLDGGADNDLLSGGFGADTLIGGSGDDYLDGGGNADTMTGGAGNDTYVVNQAGDVIVELAGGGSDRVYATGTYALGAGVEIEILAAGGANPTAAIGLSGNERADNIWANDGNNTLYGLGGNDSVFGFGGNDYLDGGTGADFMIGGTGDDVFVVDDALDYAFEYAGEGQDKVYAMSSFTLNAGSSIEILIAGGPVIPGGRNLTGNELANNIWDDAGDNDLYGAAGDDALFGFAGHDYLDGGTGADFLVGGTGDDIYVVDDGSDVVIEATGEGSDKVYAMTGFTLNAGSSIEILIAGGPVIPGGRNLTGNELANNIWDDAGDNDLYGGGGDDALFGFAGNDYLDGGTGTDFLVGGTGDDVFVVDSAGDVVVETAGEGSDTVYASADYTLAAGQSVEILAAGGSGAVGLTGNELANNLWGNTGNNALNGAGGDDAVFGFDGNDTLLGGTGGDLMVGGAGDDSLGGGDGADTLLGEAGADSFVFDTALSGGIDTIGDFSVVDDTIALDDAVFAGLTAGALAAGAFVAGTAAVDADDRIVYDAATGALWFDADGNGVGAAVQFATLNGSPVLTAGDFLVI